MKNQINSNKSLLGIIYLLIVIISLNCFISFCSAENIDSSEDNLITRSLLVNVVVDIVNNNDNTVTGLARNTMTVGFTTLQVYVYLYSSVTYSENISEMQLISYNHTSDLDIFKTIETTTSVGTESRYWMAYCRYKVNNQSWVSVQTTPLYIEV